MSIELNAKGDAFTSSDVERALWSSTIGTKLPVPLAQPDPKELNAKGDAFTPSDVERALWSSTIRTKLPVPLAQPDPKVNSNKNSKRKRKCL
ncbi:hypothetical protein U1Q18_005422 [Sarracenia purpurea var. burkii]